MEPHSENFGAYGKLCRERTNKAMLKTRQTVVCILFKDSVVFTPSWRWFLFDAFLELANFRLKVLENDKGVPRMSPLPGMVPSSLTGSKVDNYLEWTRLFCCSLLIVTRLVCFFILSHEGFKNVLVNESSRWDIMWLFLGLFGLVLHKWTCTITFDWIRYENISVS